MSGASGPPSRRILFTTSNGTGLGHLTRSMAIARRLPGEVEPIFLTLSAAAPVVEGMGFAVEYVPSYATPGSGNDYRWSRRLRSRLRRAIADADPDVVVFDGTHPYEALLGALPGHGRAVWCRRPLWKPGSSRVPLRRAAAFDAVLEPGELAEDEDAGPTVPLRARAHTVGPIVLLDRDELLDREGAASELGLDPAATNVLVALGQGAEVREATRRSLVHLAGREGIQIVALSSALAAVGEVAPGVIELRATYPMSRYFAAIDAAVAAAGYNAFHELVELGVPSLFVPMHRETDDQPARARFADMAGIGLGVSSPSGAELEAALDRLLDESERAAIAARLRERGPSTGAADAARWLAAMATGELDTEEGDPTRSSGASTARAGSIGGRDWRRRWGSFIASAPRTAWRLGRQQLTQPRARLLVLALGIDRERVAEAVDRARRGEGEAPARTIAVIDDLGALAELRAQGVGVEHIPGPGSRQAELAREPYGEFVAQRLELIRAERPARLRIVMAPGSAPVP